MAANTGPGDRPRGSPAGNPGGDRLGVLAGAYSGRVLGALVAALGAQGGFLGSRTAKRYFAGEIGTDANRRRVFAETGAALVDAGFVRTSALLRRSDVAIAVAQASLRWDRVLATLQSRSGAVGEAVVESALRLAVVDLALRAFAVRRLAGQEPPRPGTPSWALDNGGGRMLRRMAREAGVTRDGLAERLGASERAVDNWLDGRNRPTDANIEALAHALAAEGTADRVAREIRRCFALADLADRAASQLGRERVREFAAAGVRFVRRIMADVEGMDRAPVGTAALAELTALRFGTAHAMSHPLLRNLALDEADARWRQEIEASMRPWGLRLQRVAVGRGAGPAAAGLARAAADVDGYRDGGAPARGGARTSRESAGALRGGRVHGDGRQAARFARASGRGHPRMLDRGGAAARMGRAGGGARDSPRQRRGIRGGGAGARPGRGVAGRNAAAPAAVPGLRADGNGTPRRSARGSGGRAGNGTGLRPRAGLGVPVRVRVRRRPEGTAAGQTRDAAGRTRRLPGVAAACGSVPCAWGRPARRGRDRRPVWPGRSTRTAPPLGSKRALWRDSAQGRQPGFPGGSGRRCRLGEAVGGWWSARRFALLGAAELAPACPVKPARFAFDCPGGEAPPRRQYLDSCLQA